jgi:hypothetical protein
MNPCLWSNMFYASFYTDEWICVSIRENQPHFLYIYMYIYNHINIYIFIYPSIQMNEYVLALEKINPTFEPATAALLNGVWEIVATGFGSPGMYIYVYMYVKIYLYMPIYMFMCVIMPLFMYIYMYIYPTYMYIYIGMIYLYVYLYVCLHQIFYTYRNYRIPSHKSHSRQCGRHHR